MVISCEIRPLAVLYPPPPHIKTSFIGLRYRASLLISALSGRRGGMLIPTAFTPPSIVLFRKVYIIIGEGV